MVTGVLWEAFVLCMLKTILGFSWVLGGENAYLDYSLGVTNNLCRKVEGETDFLEQIAFSQFSGFTLREVVCQASTKCFSFEVLQLVKNSHSILIPHSFSRRKGTFNTSHEESGYDIIRSWKQSKSRFQIPLLQNVYLSDLICWLCSDACNFLQGRLLECEDMMVMKKICTVGELQAWVFKLDLVKSTQYQY